MRKKESSSKAAAGKKKGTDDPPKKKYSYDTDSDDELIELGDWNKKTKRGKSIEDDKEEEESEDDNEGAGDEDDDDDDEDDEDEYEDGVPVFGSSSDEDSGITPLRQAAHRRAKAILRSMNEPHRGSTTTNCEGASSGYSFPVCL